MFFSSSDRIKHIVGSIMKPCENTLIKSCIVIFRLRPVATTNIVVDASEAFYD